MYTCFFLRFKLHTVKLFWGQPTERGKTKTKLFKTKQKKQQQQQKTNYTLKEIQCWLHVLRPARAGDRRGEVQYASEETPGSFPENEINKQWMDHSPLRLIPSHAWLPVMVYWVSAFIGTAQSKCQGFGGSSPRRTLGLWIKASKMPHSSSDTKSCWAGTRKCSGEGRDSGRSSMGPPRRCDLLHMEPGRVGRTSYCKLKE